MLSVLSAGRSLGLLGAIILGFAGLTSGACSPRAEQGGPPGQDDDATACGQTCTELGYVCGDHCGTSCGECTGPGEACVEHRCVCAPNCPIERCGAPDACGGSCPACPSRENCVDCPLRLSIHEQERAAGTPQFVTLAVDYQPKDAGPLPGMADLRLRVSGAATLTDVAAGEALLAADKSLRADARTGQPFRRLADGTLQLLVMSSENRNLIAAGRWLLLRFRLGSATEPLAGPVTFALTERDQILAPAPADAALWGSRIGAPVAIWPQVNP